MRDILRMTVTVVVATLCCCHLYAQSKVSGCDSLFENPQNGNQKSTPYIRSGAYNGSAPWTQAHSFVLSGKVMDGAHRPLPYAVISIRGKERVCATGMDGSFSVRLLPDTYAIEVSLLGYKTEFFEIRIDKDTKVEWTLKEDYKLLGEVLVVAPNYAQQTQEGVYNAKSLNVRPYAASNSNLNQLMSYTSGVRIREDGGVGSSFDLSLSGLGGNAIRYFIDGVPLTSLGSGANIANLPINIVDRVEIYKGVVPPELGLDALGGAVNIVTRKEGKNFLDVALNGGSFHTYGADVSGEYRHANSGFTLRGNGSYTNSRNNYMMKGVEVWNAAKNEYEIGDYRRFHDGYQSISGEALIGFTQTKWADEVLMGVYYSQSKSEIQTGFSQQLVIGAAERHHDALRFSFNYSKRDLLVKGLTAKFFAAHTQDHVLHVDTTFRKYSWNGTYTEVYRNEVMGRANKILRHTLRPTTVVRTNVAYTLTPLSSINFNYTLTANQNRRRDDYDQTFIPSNDYLARHILGLSYSRYFWDDRINSTLFLKDYIFHAKVEQQDMYWITGGREVDPEMTRNHIGYGLGVRVSFTKEFALKLSYERATRLPTAREFLGNGASIYPNFKLRPERAHNLNIALYGTWAINPSHQVNYEGTFFVRDVTDYIRRKIEGDDVSTYDNVGAARVLGGEVDVKYRYKNLLDFAFNATYTDERNKSARLPDGRIDITYNNRIPNTPFFYTNTSLGISLQDPFDVKQSQLRFNTSFGYVHWFYLSWAAFGTNESKAVIPTQTTTNIGVVWSFNNHGQSIALSCNNVFDEVNYDNYRLQKPGRSVFCKLTTFIN